MKLTKRMLAMLLCFALVLSVWAPAASAVAPAYVAAPSGDDVDNVVELTGGEWTLTENEPVQLGTENTLYSDDDIVTVIVVMEDEPLVKLAAGADMSSDIPRYLATSRGAKENAQLLASHESVKQKLLTMNDQASVENSFDYTAVLNGFSMDMPYGMVEEASQLPGVKRVSLVEYYSVPEDQDSFDTQMTNSVGMIGSDAVNDMSFQGHDGSGAVVAILDTGLETTHDAFSAMPQSVEYEQADIQELMDGVVLSSGVTDAAVTYVNAKVPYAFDYSHGDADVNGGVAHGTHVAGTVAGNNGTDFYGVAPNAQLMIMKIFSDGEGSTSDAIITAGLDDAVKLGADSINMSLGSAAGFSWYRETEAEVYNNCYDAGINLMVAAGNDTSSTYGNQYGNGLAMADSLDNAIVGNPSTGYEAMSVASVQNAAVESDYFLFGQEKIAFGQMVYAPSSTVGNFWQQITDWSSTSMTYEYVVIPGVGEESDYENVGDLTGKLALIQRGVTNFEDKVRIARAHGAKAAIIYNNDGGVFNPAYNTFNGGMIGISQAAGEMLIAAAEEGRNFLTFGPGTVNDYPWSTPAEEKIPWKAILPADDAGQMSSFSSVGPAPDLAMKPEIAAPGGNIVSSVPGNAYQAMSGTSMATPHMAGAAALVRNYVQDVLGVTDSDDLRDITEALLMSTAVPARNASGDEYGTRWQGAGTVNVLNAVTTGAYLTVDNVDPTDDSIVVTRPKVELGWNEEGVYSFSFNIHNISDSDIAYTPMTVSLSEGITEAYGVKFADGVTRRLGEEDFSITFDAEENGTITVPAGEVVSVNATLTLSDGYMQELFANFANGNYVEGYIYLQPAEGVTLVLPYLGYCGDWTDGVVFEGDPSTNWQLQPTLFATMNIAGAGYYLGENPYNDADPYNYDRLAFAPVIDNVPQFLAMIVTTRRNLTDASISVKDGDGNVVWAMTGDYLQKSYYYPTYGIVLNTQILTDGWNGRYYNEETGLYDGDFVPAGQYYTIELAGNVAQSEEARHVVTYPLWLDAGAPEVTNIECFVDEADGKYKLSFDAQDDHYISLVNVIDSTNSYLLTYTVQDFASIVEQGTKSKVILDLDGLCQFLADNGLNPGRIKLSVMDCSMNTRDVYVDLGPQYLSLSPMTVAVGDSQAMAVRVLPARLEGNVALTWESSDETVATVDENGVVTGVAYGEALITATADTGLSAAAIVTVGDETLPPEEPETPDPDAPVDYPSAEAFPGVPDNRVEASETETLGQKFEYEGFWYKVTGESTVQLIKNPSAADYSATYPNAPAELVIPETVSFQGQDYTVTTIGPRAFYYCNQITSITLPDTIRVIGDYAFLLGYWGVKLTEMNLPEGLEEVGDYALYGSTLVDFKLPDSLRIIGTNAFAYTGITEVDFGENIEFVGSRAFMNCKSLVKAELTVQTQDTEGLYLYSDALAQAEIEEGVERIPENCFYYAAMTTVELPDSVTEIGKAAFYGTGLTDLCLEGTNVTTIGDFAYAGLSNCYDFVFPDSVTYIGSNVLYWCRYVRSVSFGANVAYIGDGMMSSFFIHGDVESVIPEVKSATAGAAVRRSGYVGRMTRDGVPFDVYTGAPFVVDGISYMPISADEVMITGYDQATVMGVVTIPETVTCEGDETVYTVTSVADRLFSQKYNITEIHLPDTITTVGERAFDQIHALSYINIPKNLTTLTGLQAFGYGGWNNLEWNGVWNPETLVVPGTLETWNTSAFSGNRYTSVILEEGLEMVGSYGVSNNNNLTKVEMAGTVRYIKDNAFANNPLLTNVELPEGLEYIGAQAFLSDPLESVTLPDSLRYIGSKAFSAFYTDYNTPYPYVKTYVGVEKVTIPGGVMGLGWDAFEAPVLVTTTLGSQRNLVVERCNLDNLPTVRWDGRTDIPEGDYSVVPEGATVWVTEDVVIDGELRIEGELRVEYGMELTIGDTGTVIGEENIVYETCPHENVAIETVEPTCTIDGTATAICLDCGETLATERLLAKGHNGCIVGYVEATCDAKGYTGDLVCQVCGELLRRGEIMNAWCPSGEYTDLDTGKWYHEYTDYVLKNGIMNGVSPTEFQPEGTMTRGMLVTTLHRMAGSPEVSGEAAFTDVDADRYYADAVAWAYELGIAKGMTEDTFAPNAPVTRQQAATFLYRYAELVLGADVSAAADLSTFTDGGEVSGYSRAAMAWAVASGLFRGYGDGTLKPAEALTRAQMAKLLTVLDTEF